MSEEERKLIERNIVYEDTLLEITPELMKKTIVKQDKEIERLNNIINEAKEFIYENAYDKERKICIDDLWGEIPKLLEILDKVGDEK